MVGGALLVIVGIGLLGGAAQAAAIGVGAVFFMFALVRGLDTDDSGRREPPAPPGDPSGV
jgi:hypothetical protein